MTKWKIGPGRIPWQHWTHPFAGSIKHHQRKVFCIQWLLPEMIWFLWIGIFLFLILFNKDLRVQKLPQRPVKCYSDHPFMFPSCSGIMWGGGGSPQGNSWLDSGKMDQTSASNKRHLHISHLFFIIYRSNLPKFGKGEYTSS